MLEVMTWLAVTILGPGALVIFVWFLIDYRRLLRWRRSEDRRKGEKHEADRAQDGP